MDSSYLKMLDFKNFRLIFYGIFFISLFCDSFLEITRCKDCFGQLTLSFAGYILFFAAGEFLIFRFRHRPTQSSFVKDGRFENFPRVEHAIGTTLIILVSVGTFMEVFYIVNFYLVLKGFWSSSQ